MLKEKIKKLLSKNEIKRITEEIRKAKNPFAIKISFENNKINVIDLNEKLNKNDIVYFNENGLLQKAVVTAKGKHGITCRDKNQSKIKLRYKDIIEYKKRK